MGLQSKGGNIIISALGEVTKGNHPEGCRTCLVGGNLIRRGKKLPLAASFHFTEQAKEKYGPILQPLLKQDSQQEWINLSFPWSVVLSIFFPLSGVVFCFVCFLYAISLIYEPRSRRQDICLTHIYIHTHAYTNVCMCVCKPSWEYICLKTKMNVWENFASLFAYLLV